MSTSLSAAQVAMREYRVAWAALGRRFPSGLVSHRWTGCGSTPGSSRSAPSVVI